ARRPEGTLERVGYPIPEYPLCSEYVLDASNQPRRVDTEREHAMCLVQTLLADRSALFTFFSLRISRNPAALLFLYRLGSPVQGAERQTIVAGDDVPQRRELAPATALTAALLRALAHEVRESGAELMFLVVPSYWSADLHP